MALPRPERQYRASADQEPAAGEQGGAEVQRGGSTIEKFRKLIDNKDYLDQAIHRIAQIISNELMQDSGQGV
jgi:hypothetical protein